MTPTQSERRLHVQVDGAGPTVVLDTGGAGQGVGTWLTIAPELSKRATVVTYDRAGVGGSSDLAKARTVAEMAADLHATLHDSGVALPAVFVGWSFGGLVTQVYAMRYPQDVAGLVFIDPTPVEHLPVGRIRRRLAEWVPLLTVRAFHLLSASGFVKTAPGRRLIDWRARRRFSTDQEVAMYTQFLTNAPALKQMVSLLSRYPHNLREVRSLTAHGDFPAVPMRVITAGKRAEADKPKTAPFVAHIRDSHARLAARSPLGRLVVAVDSGHQVPASQPELILDVVDAVLSDLAREAAS